MRRMLIEIGHEVSRTRGGFGLERSYIRIRARSSARVAIVSLARKIVCILKRDGWEGG